MEFHLLMLKHRAQTIKLVMIILHHKLRIQIHLHKKDRITASIRAVIIVRLKPVMDLAIITTVLKPVMDLAIITTVLKPVMDLAIITTVLKPVMDLAIITTVLKPVMDQPVVIMMTITKDLTIASLQIIKIQNLIIMAYHF